MGRQTWVSLFGNAQIEDGTITHSPTPASTDSTAMPSAEAASVQAPHVIVRSNIEFEQGSISWEANLGDPDCKAQLMLAAEPSASSASGAPVSDSVSAELVVGLNVLGAPYGFAIFSGGWEPAGGSGLGSVLPAREWIGQKLSVRGSNLELYVRGVRVLSTTRTLKRGQISVLLQGNSVTAIRNVTVTAEAPTCFVVMQFTDSFNALYQDVIRPICELYGYKVLRSDEFFTSAQILDDIIRSIRSASLIIADVTPKNENVFYELGFAHAINKPTILLSDRTRERLPFDVAGFRTLFYDNTIAGKAVVEARLKQHLAALQAR